MDYIKQSVSVQKSLCSSPVLDSRVLGHFSASLFSSIRWWEWKEFLDWIIEFSFTSLNCFSLIRCSSCFLMLKLGHINTSLKLHWDYEQEMVIFLLHQARATPALQHPTTADSALLSPLTSLFICTKVCFQVCSTLKIASKEAATEISVSLEINKVHIYLQYSLFFFFSPHNSKTNCERFYFWDLQMLMHSRDAIFQSLWWSW